MVGDISPEQGVRLKEILFRLLTHADMRDAWKTLLSAPVKGVTLTENSRAHYLWVTIHRAIRHFSYQIDKTQTASEKKRTLQKIAKQVAELQAAIEGNSNASEIAGELIHSQMAKASLDFRLEHGEKPNPREYNFVNLLFESDRREWRHLVFNEELDAYTGNPSESPYIIIDEEIGAYALNPAASPRTISWREQSLLNRLGHWATWGNELSFVRLLGEYADWLLLDADRPPEIKQPGRGEEALKSFLIRRLHKLMIQTFGQPLDQVVAVVATVVLDLPSPLSRDDVRPYIKG